MALSSGTRLGPYEVIAAIGSGGMGEVYRARDTALGRDVALKILPDAVARDSDRLARFQREAQLLAALNHPRIAAVYGLESTTDRRALVMELVPGPTLAELIERGAGHGGAARGLEIAEAIAIARQIAEALEAAHAQGIVHRDLKPANIKVGDDGAVKVLDFGLAKALAPEGASGADQATSPTITSPAMTGLGMILGTAPYMAPEQARGKPIDKRVDVWAFGCVLFEMLTGRRAFAGDDVTEAIAAVINKEPDWAALPRDTPASIRALLGVCLQKERAARLRDLGDARLVLDGAFATAAAPRDAPQRGRTLIVAAATALVAATLAGSAVWFYGRPAPAARQVTRFQFTPPEGVFAPGFSLSPDGGHLAFMTFLESEVNLWIHSFESGQSRKLLAAGGVPIWSPDSRSVAVASQGALRKVDLLGGSPEDICKLQTVYFSGSWSPQGTIVFGRSTGGIMQVPASGGEPNEVTTVDSDRAEMRHAGPVFLPGGRRFVYLRLSSVSGNSGIYVGSLDSRPEAQSRERLIATESEPLVTTTADGVSFVLYVRGQTLLAQHIDAAAGLIGAPVQVVTPVGTSFLSVTLASVSQTGALAYRGVFQAAGGTPTWVTPTGREAGVLTGFAGGRASYPRVSPDGRRVALAVGGDVWVYHMDGRPPVRLTFGGLKSAAYSPLWSPDGARIVYEPNATGLLSVAADGSQTAPDAASPPGHYHPHGWIPARRDLLAILLSPATNWDIVRIAPTAAGKPTVLVETPAVEGFGGVSLSPDERWLAYTSNATGADEVYVRAFGETGPTTRVSPRGGWEPRWAPNGRELFFLQGTNIVSVTVTSRNPLTFSQPVPLFEYTYGTTTQPPSYDVAPDGRFLILKAPPAPPQPTEVVLNWTELLPK